MADRSYVVQSTRARPVMPEEYLSFYVDGWHVLFSIKTKEADEYSPATITLNREQAKEFVRRLSTAISDYEAEAAEKYRRAKERRQKRKGNVA